LLLIPGAVKGPDDTQTHVYSLYEYWTHCL